MGPQLLCACICDHNIVFSIETEIKKIFRKKFKKHDDGHEYFEGCPKEMLSIIYDFTNKSFMLN